MGGFYAPLYKKDCGNKENTKLFYLAVVEAKKNPTDENVAKVLGFINKGFRIANENGLEYDIDSGKVFFEGFSTPIPSLLVKTIEDYHENGYPMESIVNFWKLLMANPDVRVRELLFKFIQKHDFAITDNGYMVVYKAVEWFDSVSENLKAFVTSASYHVRKDWKCSPKKYVVYQQESEEGNEVYKITKETTFNKWDVKEKGVKFIGNLKELENSADESENVAFIPRYVTWNKDKFDLDKEKILLGVSQKTDRKECDSDPRNECSYGLHVGATKYVKSFASYSSVVLVCFVNPMNVIAVPDYDNSKMRVSEYFPYAIANRDSKGDIDIVEQTYFEHDYISHEKQELEKIIKKIKEEESGISMDNEAPEDDRKLEEVLKVLNARIYDLN